MPLQISRCSQVIPKPAHGIIPCSPCSSWAAGSVSGFGFHGFLVTKVLEEEGFVLVCEVPAIPGHADLS